MSATVLEWISIAVGVGDHVIIMTLSFTMSMFPGIGKSTNFTLRYFAFWANRDFLYCLFAMPRLFRFFANSDMLL